MSRVKDVWIIAGPTASGKSHLAIELARYSNGVVINADSMQIYREIPILTAQPSAADRALVSHYLYGFQLIRQNYSAAQWAQAASDTIRQMIQSNRQPILVGGSGLYFKALTEGFSPMPDVPTAVRNQVTDLYDLLGPEGFHSALNKIDPVLAEKLHPTDRQRCIRAREVYEASGEKLSTWQGLPKNNVAPELKYRSVVLLPDRTWLHARINGRFHDMIEHGALEEARLVHSLNPDDRLTGTQALGLQALRDHIDGRLTLAEAVEQGQNQSRQYAKRQYTWFRGQSMPNALTVNAPVEEWLDIARKHLVE
jgi:tRNA dimethylallyltransferase